MEGRYNDTLFLRLTCTHYYYNNKRTFNKIIIKKIDPTIEIDRELWEMMCQLHPLQQTMKRVTNLAQWWVTSKANWQILQAPVFPMTCRQKLENMLRNYI